MNPLPVAVGLMLCHHGYVEEGETKRVSLIGSFTDLRVDGFPA
jgi:hypothetical protein